MKVRHVLLCAVLFPLAASVPCMFLVFLLPPWSIVIVYAAVLCLLYVLFRKKLDLAFCSRVNGILAVLFAVVFTVLMVIASGNARGTTVGVLKWVFFPFWPVSVMMSLMIEDILLYLLIFAGFLSAAVLCAVLGEVKPRRIICVTAGAVLLCCLAGDAYLYVNRPEVRYGGHGFAYMNGYSSTDFTDYMVYSENSRLVTLDHPAYLRIDDVEDMPIMDGAEACYPVYAAIAKAVYRDIDRIEEEALASDAKYANGRVVTFTNSVYGFYRLLNGAAPDSPNDHTDLFFGARPSRDQLQEAAEAKVELNVTPVGREAFVFFVEKDNPVEGLTSEQVRAIYHGDITNWSEVGGKNQKIIAFQRPARSGSQTMMEYFMGELPLKEPMTYETVDAMTGVIENVAQFANEAGALGYTFRYFLEGLHQEEGVKMLSIDGVYPTMETIEDGTYPLTVDLCLITRAENQNPYVQKMIDFTLSEDGQTIIYETGYGRINR